jgi:Flp pilus assembly protein TadG
VKGYIMLCRTLRRTFRQRPGAAAVELAILLPFLAFIWLVAVDYCRVFYYSLTIDNCARNGAHFGSQVDYSYAGPQEWQNNGALIASIQDATVADGAKLNPPLSASNVTVTNGTDANGNPMVQVTVNYLFQTLTNYPGIPNQVKLVRMVQMRVAPQTPNWN